jgi:hypothetical protein
MSCCGQKRSELRPPQDGATPRRPADGATTAPGVRSALTTQALATQLRAFLARKAMTAPGPRLSRIRSTGKG